MEKTYVGSPRGDAKHDNELGMVGDGTSNAKRRDYELLKVIRSLKTNIYDITSNQERLVKAREGKRRSMDTC